MNYNAIQVPGCGTGTTVPVSSAEALALHYAPDRWRGDYLALFALGSRSRLTVMQAREPMLAQIKLAWWREQIETLRPGGTHPEPVLNLIAQGWLSEKEALAALIGGYEGLLAPDDLSDEAIAAFIDAMAGTFASVARLTGNDREADAAKLAGLSWGAACMSSVMQQQTPASVLAESHLLPLPRLSRSLRPLSVLHALANRSLRRGGAPLVDGRGSVAVAFRAGLCGR